jgi:DNA transposition AAA+ family ATPase
MAASKSARVNPESPPPTDGASSLVGQSGRSPEIQAEVERIGQADTYLALDRDEAFFKWLNDLRDARLCGYVVAAHGSGLARSCQFYRMRYVRRRGSLLEIPATVVYAEVEQYGSPSDLFISILQEFDHPLAQAGSLRDLRSRTWGTVKAYGVKILVIGNADCLTLEAFNELIRIYSKLRIPVVLVGTDYLSA